MIHGENPFLEEPANWDPARRFRGRLSAPVTIITSGEESNRTGLTVSSLFVIEGEPARIHAVVGPTTDLWDIARDYGRFVIHICHDGHRALAEVFAGLRPSPGGLFATPSVSGSDWGPILEDLPDRALCTFESRDEVGFSGVIVGRVDHIEVSNLSDPLVHFRGSYRDLG